MASSFAEEVYRIVRRIPKGEVTTYKAVAKTLGKPQAFRAVGNALNKNLHPPKFCEAKLWRASVSAVPCHRVVLSDGRVGGYARGTAKKIKILKREGVEIEKGRIDLRKFGYFFGK